MSKHFIAYSNEGVFHVSDNNNGGQLEDRELFIEVSENPTATLSSLGFLHPFNQDDDASTVIDRENARALRDWLTDWLGE